MAEFDIIQRYFTRPTCAGVPDENAAHGIDLGIGDDAALIAPGLDGDSRLVVATDTLNQDVHFLPHTPAFDLGHRVLAVNLSDMAAMGAQPRWAQLALSLAQVDEAWLADFAAGFFALADPHGVSLTGGDTTRGPLAMTVTMIGTVPYAKALTRHGASAGEHLYVTGWPGEAAAGLALWRESAVTRATPADHPARTDTPPKNTAAGAGKLRGMAATRAYLRCRFSRPEPRVDFALGLRRQRLATAAIDVSDGLLGDADKLARASGVHLRIQQSSLPCSEALLQMMDRETALGLIQAGGDDYELLFTAPPQAAPAIAKLAERSGLGCTRIGEAVAPGTGAGQAPAVGLYDGERVLHIDQLGYEHFT